MLSKRDPKKWQKYELLAQFGLCELKQLRGEILRYRPSDVQRLVADVLQGLAKSHGNRLAVVKFVSESAPGQLTNLRLTFPISEKKVLDDVCEHLTSEIVELWVCFSQISRKPGNFAGRWLLDFDSLKKDTIELIWWTSPRLIEQFPEFGSFPYARFERKAGEILYRETACKIPKGAPLDHENVIESLKTTLRLFAEHDVGIECIVGAVQLCKLSCMSIEFKFQNDVGRMIDWDTPNDDLVLKRFS